MYDWWRLVGGGNVYGQTLRTQAIWGGETGATERSGVASNGDIWGAVGVRSGAENEDQKHDYNRWDEEY